MKAEGRPSSKLALDTQRASGLLGKAVHLTQAQARSLAWILGGVEGLEDTLKLSAGIPVPVSVTWMRTKSPDRFVPSSR
jgi:hypothetical protein